jgi:hypothetical protein
MAMTRPTAVKTPVTAALFWKNLGAEVISKAIQWTP